MDNSNFDSLMEFFTGFAEQSLKNRKEFHPFAAAIDTSGTIKPLAVTGELALDSEQAIETFRTQLREMALNKEIVASGVCSDVRLVQPIEKGMNDAIMMELEEVPTRSARVYIPYRFAFLGKLKFGEVSAVKNDSHVFETDDPEIVESD
jgi:hypothetical protein